MKTYLIKKTNIDNVPIDSAEWEKAEVAEINNEAPGSTYSPITTAKLLYSESGITVKLETDEKPLRSTVTERDSEVVCEDSCMEVFIAPKESNEYFNFEINPIGTLHLGLGKDRYNRKHLDVKTEVFDIKCTFENEKWQLKFYIPFSVVDSVFGSHSKSFKGNLYKCGEKTEKEHYLTWNVVATPVADFHLSEFFGEFILQ